MRARYVIESERWSDMKGQGSFDNIDELFALGMSALKLGDRGRRRRRSASSKRCPPATDAALREQASVMLHELGALLLLADGQQSEAFAAMDRAVAAQARMPKPIGRPYPVKGADELYGELLLQVGRAEGGGGLVRARADAHAQPQPRRARSRARGSQERRRGQEPDRLHAVVDELATADPGLPELAEARAALKRN